MKYLLMDRSSRIKAPPRPLNAKKEKRAADEESGAQGGSQFKWLLRRCAAQ